MVRRFRVDGIPHLAFIGSNQEVKTALVGSIPKTVLKDEIVALLQVLQSAIDRLCCLRKSLYWLLNFLYVGETNAIWRFRCVRRGVTFPFIRCIKILCGCAVMLSKYSWNQSHFLRNKQQFYFRIKTVFVHVMVFCFNFRQGWSSTSQKEWQRKEGKMFFVSWTSIVALTTTFSKLRTQHSYMSDGE